jgi:hypothetical protein
MKEKAAAAAYAFRLDRLKHHLAVLTREYK